MEMIWMLVGCVASFLCGAYVRAPFSPSRGERREEEPKELEEQWENFWRYDGEDRGE